MAQIFISYDRDNNKKEADIIKAKLETRGVSVWMDTEINWGQDWQKEIEQQLDSAERVIVLWSPTSINSRYVRAEAEHANTQNKLLPAAIRGLDPKNIPMFYRGIQWFVINDWETDLSRLTLAVSRALAIARPLELSDLPKPLGSDPHDERATSHMETTKRETQQIERLRGAPTGTSFAAFSTNRNMTYYVLSGAGVTVTGSLLLLLLAGGIYKELRPLSGYGAFGVFVAIIFLCALIARTRRYLRLKVLPLQSRYFNPFLLQGRAEVRNNFLLQREKEVAALEQAIADQASATKHVVLVGKSGVGKSTLLQTYLRQRLEGHGWKVLYFNEYVGFLQTLIFQLNLAGPKPNEMLEERLQQQITAFANDQVTEERLSQEINGFMQLVARESRLVVIFDQAERYLSQLSGDDHDEYSTDRELFPIACRALRVLRLREDVRTVISIRSDHMYQSIDNIVRLELGQARASDSEGLPPDVLSTILRYENLYGIDMHNAAASSALKEKFVAITGAPGKFKHFGDILQLSVTHKANTFMTQLLGFLIEQLYASDKRIRDIVDGGPADQKVLLDIYTEYLADEFERILPERESKQRLGAVIYAIAAENRLLGRPVSVNRAAGIVHLPSRFVAAAFRFLSEKGVLVSTRERGVVRFRIVHDILSDYFATSTIFQTRPDLRDSIRFLVESRVQDSKLRIPSPATSLWNVTNMNWETITQLIFLMMI
jgi:hypothetical protein